MSGRPLEQDSVEGAAGPSSIQLPTVDLEAEVDDLRAPPDDSLLSDLGDEPPEFDVNAGVTPGDRGAPRGARGAGRQVQLGDALRRGGVSVVEHPGWQERGSSNFNPRGVVCHHTGPWSTVKGMVALCTSGRADLSGPLANVVLAPDGVAHVIAAGRANHAGPGGWRELQGNSSVFGIEAIHSGSASAPWPAPQLEAYHRICAAMCDLIGAPVENVCAHREWTRRKPDPVHLDMSQFRRAVVDIARPDRLEIRPMFDPPIGPIAANWIETLPDGRQVVIAQVGPDGAVFAWATPYVGGMNVDPFRQHFVGRKAAAIGPRDDGTPGYMITATTGEKYNLP